MPRAMDAISARLGKRVKTLTKKARELATLCNIDIAVICAARASLSLMWPSKQAALATVSRFNALPLEERASLKEDHADHFARRLAEERQKLVRAQEGGVAGALGSWDGALEDMAEEQLRELLASIEGSLVAAKSRTLKPQLQSGGASDCARRVPQGPLHADEATAETSVSVTARNASEGARRRLGKADAGGPVSGLALEASPTKAPNAAPLVADQVTSENSESSTVRAGGNELHRPLFEVDALELPLEANSRRPHNAAPPVSHGAVEGDDESEDAQILLVKGDADDAEWMRDLVEALKKIPQPSNAAPNYDETEYLHIGGYAIELDAYDYICFDLGMLPPYIGVGPDSPGSGDDQPLKLWSWE